MINFNNKSRIAIADRLVHMPGFVLFGTADAPPRPGSEADPAADPAAQPDSCT